MKIMRLFRSVLLALMTAAPGAVMAQTGTTVVDVDLATSIRAAEPRGSGMHGASRLSIPIEMELPIRISMVRRANDDTWKRGQELFDRTGRTFIIEEVFSQTDIFNESLNRGDFGPWEENVKSKIAAMKQNKAKYPNVDYRYDIWNEPGGFDKVSEQTFTMAWVRAAKLVKENDPGKLIVGPSYSDFFAGNRRAQFRRFLMQTKAAGVLPDYLCWHEGIGAANPAEFESRILAARAMMTKPLNEGGAGLGAPLPIEWNEMISDVNKTDPGGAIVHFASLERFELVIGGKAYWGDSGGYPGGTTPPYFLNHLLTKEYKPRSIWWAYERYARLTGKTVKVRYSSNADAVVAKDASRKNVTAVVGKYNSTGEVTIRFAHLDALGYFGDKVRVKGELIPNSGVNTLAGPVPQIDQVFSVTDGQIDVPLSMNRWEGYYLELTPPGPTTAASASAPATASAPAATGAASSRPASK